MRRTLTATRRVVGRILAMYALSQIVEGLASVNVRMTTPRWQGLVWDMVAVPLVCCVVPALLRAVSVMRGRKVWRAVQWGGGANVGQAGMVIVGLWIARACAEIRVSTAMGPGGAVMVGVVQAASTVSAIAIRWAMAQISIAAAGTGACGSKGWVNEVETKQALVTAL